MIYGQEEIESTTLNGILRIMRSCSKAKTVKRLVYTSTAGTITVQPQPPVSEFTEDLWSDIDLCYQHKMYGWVITLYNSPVLNSSSVIGINNVACIDM